jgi:O-antigen/teichoic acid export membrane protein
MSFKRHLILTSGTHSLVFLLGFIMSILNARFLGPSGVGVMALLMLLTGLSARISDVGFGNAFRYFSANNRIDYVNLIRTINIIGSIISIIVVILCFIIWYLPLGIWNDIQVNIFLVYLPTPLFYTLTLYYRSLLHGKLEINAVNLSEIFERFLYIMLFILFVWLLDLGIKGAALALSISTFFLFIQLYFKANKIRVFHTIPNKLTPLKQTLKTLFSYGKWSYFSLFIEYILLNFPVLFLKSSSGSFADIGYFNKAQGLANYPRIPAVPLSGLLFSYNAGATEADATQRTEILCRLSFWLFTILFFILAIFIKPFIKLLYGEEFLPAAEIYLYLYPSVVLYINSLYLSSAIAARGFNKDTFLIRLKSLPFILVLTYVLISYYNLIGAAISISLSFTILWVQYSLKFFKLFNSNFSNIILLNKKDVLLLKDLIAKAMSKLKPE